MSNKRPRTVRPACALAWLLAGALACSVVSGAAADETSGRKIVFLAGTVHQGPGGHPPGTHEYELTARLLARAVENAGSAGIEAEVHFDGWPRDPATLDDADTIVVISDGADRSEQDHPLLVGDRLQAIEKQMRRGCGLVAVHWTVFVPNERGGPQFLDWIGGYFDYQSGSGPRKWFSKIQTATTRPRPAAPEHPICRGLAPFELREEYYYNVRFRDDDPRLVPILSTSIPDEPREQVVAWAVERDDGGRGFGFTGGHFFDNWGVGDFRRMMVNAILWTAHADVPAGGAQTSAPTPAPKPPQADDKPIQAVIVTGHQHPAHAWRDTSAALQDALAQDRRMQLTVVTDPEFLASPNLRGYDVVVLNYCNWQRPGLCDAAKENFVEYLSGGGGLAIVHFSNGAFHASLPETPDSDWPEYRNICRRVWDHAPGKSSHDPYGRFTVHVEQDHPITLGLNSFETTDELYCNQQGEMSIEVLATARSTITGSDEPMAFVYDYGRGRVFQTVLGHDAASIRAPGASELIRRGTIWAAGHPQRQVPAGEERQSAVPPKLAPEGRFGAALDPRGQAASAAHQADYARRPLTVECFAKLDGQAGFNILAANQPKESAEHWELYTYAGSGEFSLYRPGFEPSEIKSGVDVVDGSWHHVAAAFDDNQATLYVDGMPVKQTTLARRASGGPTGPLWIGGYPPQNIGCDGLVDELRISSTLRAIDGMPQAPFAVESETLGLWHFDRVEAGRVEDAAPLANGALGGTSGAATFPLRARRPADPRHKLVSIATSPDESFLSLRTDTAGRLFVGGREGLFVCEPDASGGYAAPRLLYRFPPDSWVTDVEIRGDDLYVMTNAALYLLEGGRVEREDLVPRRLLWGSPVDLHVTWHGLDWGPEGDLYFSSGDPLLNYGDFQNRPDHWGHWTIYCESDGAKVPYTGVGGFFHCRPDGSRLQVVASGTRGAVGIAFDRRWNLFSNDNDHESLAHRYSPARLLHVAPRANFFWPRGWIAGMSPERSDLLDIVNDTLGREVPVGQAYHDESRLGPEYADSLLVALWGQRMVDGFALERHGASFRGRRYPLLIGDELARPVGVTVGPDGRVLAAFSYMAANEWSPKYPSEIVIITPADEAPDQAYEPYDLPALAAERLWNDLSSPSWQRRRDAQLEILRRGEPLLAEAVKRLEAANDADAALVHLVWLAAASGDAHAAAALLRRADHEDAEVRSQVIRALAEFCDEQIEGDIFARALGDASPVVRHAAVVALFDRKETLPEELFAGPARSSDTYLRQASALLIAERASAEQLAELLASSDPKCRLAGVLGSGFRLTVPRAVGPLPDGLPLKYESKNADFEIQYADARVDLKQLGPVGSFTTAERWKAVEPSPAERAAFEALAARRSDTDEAVHAQAAYFLSLLNDTRANQLVAAARRSRILDRLASIPPAAVAQVWQIGPFDDGPNQFATAHPPQQGPIELDATIKTPTGEERNWQRVSLAPIGKLAAAGQAGPVSSYWYLRLQSRQTQNVALNVSGASFQMWHNGRAIEAAQPAILTLDPGSNDVLLRLAHDRQSREVTLAFRAAARVELTLPEKLGADSLATRLRDAGHSGSVNVPSEFLSVDWVAAARRGDTERGRRLFGADALGCVKCHAILPEQAGGGAPSLADASKRFTVAHLVESILAPSQQVSPVFGSTSLVTDDGQVLSGLVLEEDEGKLVLLLPTAARREVSKEQIVERQLQAVSPMPGGLVKTPAELGDLLAYLLSANPRAP